MKIMSNNIEIPFGKWNSFMRLHENDDSYEYNYFMQYWENKDNRFYRWLNDDDLKNIEEHKKIYYDSFL